ncbi:MAG: glycosyltransferase [Candidatus Omnitrophica bacterium CG11_big_fil_rev_8_21_14_0_20_42_13]|uniref:Glycosyltransferase n=1 Tax=Candidatus Ghiorseimicrobium undicola TaxID=1974746 RepID=A0A2H0LWN5_9BACT|nr:MAG: glycosyltransferase [Candidatus Omnitrophica bacterium CG11_big_fil_rev_8_21_14_0_20_42_13]
MISIIIPTYNEEAATKAVLENISLNKNIEVIVVDGGSPDNTIKIAGAYPVAIIKSEKNRAGQMNKGGESAQGEILLFLHADCALEAGALEAAERAIAKGFIGGAFSQRINSGKLIYRLIESSGNLRAGIFKIFYGDQAVFVRKDIFLKLGGFDKVDLFEDVLFSRKLKRQGRLCLLNKRVFSSPRRWERQGILKTTFINWLLGLGFILGFSTVALKKFYYDLR